MSSEDGCLIKTAYACLTAAAVPALLLRAGFSAEWRRSIPERLGLGGWLSEERRQVPLWIHAASVGELTGVYPLVRALNGAVPVDQILITTTSLTGQAELLKKGVFSFPHLLPLDQPLLQRRVISKVSPRAVAVAETEIWPGLLAELARRSVPTVLFNARISDYSFPKYLRLKRFLKESLGSLHSILVQTQTDRERFTAIGAPADRVFVMGSTKYDLPPLVLSDDDRRVFAAELGLDSGAPCFVAGSVRPDEDRQVIQGYRHARRDIPELQMIIAPRHPDRFYAVERLLEEAGEPFNKRSGGPASDRRRVLLLDTIGELRKCYALGDISFVGGTLVDIGGHNPLEPAAFGVPVLMGPNSGNVRDAVAELRRTGGMVEVYDAESLAQAIRRFLTDSAAAQAAGAGAKEAARGSEGASFRVAEVLRQIVGGDHA